MVFWDVITCSLVDKYRHFAVSAASVFQVIFCLSCHKTFISITLTTAVRTWNLIYKLSVCSQGVIFLPKWGMHFPYQHSILLIFIINPFTHIFQAVITLQTRLINTLLLCGNGLGGLKSVFAQLFLKFLAFTEYADHHCAWCPQLFSVPILTS